VLAILAALIPELDHAYLTSKQRSHPKDAPKLSAIMVVAAALVITVVRLQDSVHATRALKKLRLLRAAHILDAEMVEDAVLAILAALIPELDHAYLTSKTRLPLKDAPKISALMVVVAVPDTFAPSHQVLEPATRALKKLRLPRAAHTTDAGKAAAAALDIHAAHMMELEHAAIA